MENKLSRRDFLLKATSVLGIGAFAGAFLPMLTSCEKDEVQPSAPPPDDYTVSLDLSKYPELSNVGVAKKITLSGKNNNNPVLVYRVDAANFMVVTSVCPHQGGSIGVSGSAPNVDYKCPLHFATFSPATGILESKGSTSDNIPNLDTFESLFVASDNILKIKI